MGELVRTEKAIAWMSFPTTGDIDIETLIGGQMRFVVIRKVPFTKKAGKDKEVRCQKS